LNKDPTTGVYARTDITSSLVGVVDSSSFKVSERCDRLVVDNDVYFRSAAGQFTKSDMVFQ
jgi:hypothetical protein